MSPDDTFQFQSWKSRIDEGLGIVIFMEHCYLVHKSQGYAFNDYNNPRE